MIIIQHRDIKMKQAEILTRLATKDFTQPELSRNLLSIAWIKIMYTTNINGTSPNSGIIYPCHCAYQSDYLV
jgi:arginine repressor